MSRLIETRIQPQLFACMLCLAAALPMTLAQETESQGNATATEKNALGEKTNADKPKFSVPQDATADELFGFITEVRRTRPAGNTTRTEAIEHLKLQIAAVLSACEEIRKSRPAAATELKAINEQLGALSALKRYDPKAAAPESEALIEEAQPVIKEVFTEVEKDGLDMETYRVLSGIGRTLGYSDSPEVGAELYERMAAAMEVSEDKDLVERAEKARGSARRLRLPGKFMELNGRTAEGETFDWASYRGKVVLVDFWASWCGPCRAEIPNMKAQLEKYGDKGFAIVGINLDRTHEAYQKYVDAQELTWTNLMSDQEGEMGWDNPIATQYGITGIPTAILVDKEGKVVSMQARGQELNKQLAELLGSAEESEAAAEGDEVGDS